MRILLILIFLCSTANAALTPNKLPKTKTGGSSPTLQDSVIYDDGTNVGIGSTSPNALLDVGVSSSETYTTKKVKIGSGITLANYGSNYAGIWIANTSTPLAPSANNYALISDGSGTILNSPSSSGTIYFKRGNVDTMMISNTGNLGIGITNPQAKLAVVGGNVGIGTWAPQKALHVVSADTDVARLTSINGNAAFQLYNNNNGVDSVFNTSAGRIDFSSRFNASESIEVAYIRGAYAGSGTDRTGMLQFVTYNGGSATERMRILNTGNIGIGTIAPVAELEVTQTDALDAFRVNDQATDTTPFIIDSTGNVGIGTTLPTNRFVIDNNYVQIDVNGKMKLARNITTTPAIAQIDFSNSVGFLSSSTVYGIVGEVFNSGTGNVIGYNATAGSSVTGTVSELRGIAAGVRTLAAGTNITTSSMIYANTPTITAGTIGTQRGVYIADQEVSGVTTGYGVYQEASDNDNYFAGNVGIGSVTPSSILDIDIGTGVGQVTINGSTGGCLMIRDTDDAGWTECDVLDGVMTCSIDADGICD